MERLKEYIERKGGIRKSATELGVSHSLLSLVLQGKRNLPVEVKERIEAELDSQKIEAGISIEEALRQFYFSREVEGKSSQTVEFYRWKLEQFKKFLVGLGAKVVEDLSPAHIREFLSIMKATNNSGGIHAYYRAIRAFTKFLESEGIISNNPLERIRVKQERKIIPTLKPEQLREIFTWIPRIWTREFEQKRNKALLAVLLDTGVRRGELLSMQIKDLDFEKGLITVKGKTGFRRVSLSHPTLQLVKDYLNLREDDNSALWISNTGEAMSINTLREIFRHLKTHFPDLASILHPHTFRHTCGVSLIRAGMNFRLVQEHLGHVSLSMTQHYTRTIEVEDVARIHKDLSPVKGIL